MLRKLSINSCLVKKMRERSQNKHTVLYKSGDFRHFRRPLKNKNCIRGEIDSLMPVNQSLKHLLYSRLLSNDIKISYQYSEL